MVSRHQIMKHPGWVDWLISSESGKIEGEFLEKDQEGTEPDSTGDCLRKRKSLDFPKLGIFLAIVISAIFC